MVLLALQLTNVNLVFFLTTNLIIFLGKPSLFGKNHYVITQSETNLKLEFQALSYPPYEIGPICIKIVQRQSVAHANMLSDQKKYFLKSYDLLEKKMSTRFLIVLKNVSSRHDSGIYNCSVKNAFGEAYFAFVITTKSKSNLSSKYLMI